MFFCPPLREREREKSCFVYAEKGGRRRANIFEKNQNISISFKNHRDVISLRLYIVFIVEYNIIEKYFSLFD